MVESEKVNGENGAHAGNGEGLHAQLTQTYRLIYFSTSLLPSIELGGERAIQDVLAVSLSRNQKCGVTGVLAFNDLRFAGVLEGEKADVLAIFRSVQNDRRHADVVVVEEGWLAQRGFTGWGMAFVGDPGVPRLISANLQLQDILGRESWVAIAVVEMLKYFLINAPAKS